MSLSPAEDPDPLLEYSTEPGGSAAKPVDSPEARIEHLERALEESHAHNESLKSELATLVRAVADIRAQLSRPSPPEAPPARRARATRTYAIPAVIGLLLGSSLGILGWMFLANEDVNIARPTTVSAQALPPTPEPVTQPAIESDIRGLAPNVAREPVGYTRGLAPNVAKRSSTDEGYIRGQPPNVASKVKYVGTLSIDAAPGGEVFLNRQSAGHTPLRLTNLRAGSHLIWIERDGFKRFTRVVQVPADRVTRLFADLEPAGSR